MKKTIFVLALAGLAFASCKKDRVCSCKTVTKTTGGSVAVADVVKDQDYTLVKVSRKTAYNACTHTTQTYTSGAYTITRDNNCSIK